jgi:hypothetical protein
MLIDVIFDIQVVHHKMIGVHAVEHLGLLFVRNILWLSQVRYQFI